MAARPAYSSTMLTSLLKLSNTRRVTISEFKKKTYVGIREFYEKDGELLPGKKVRGYFRAD